MSLKRKYGLLASSAAVALLLAACGGDTGSEDTDTGTDNGGDTAEVEDGDTGSDIPEFEQVVENEGDPIDGGTLRIAMVADSAFPGIFSSAFYGINLDALLMGPTRSEEHTSALQSRCLL